MTWQLPQDLEVDGVVVENQGSSSTLQLVNVTWRNSGRYTCEEVQEDQSRHVDVFIPGEGKSPTSVFLCFFFLYHLGVLTCNLPL